MHGLKRLMFKLTVLVDLTEYYFLSPHKVNDSSGNVVWF